MSDQQTTPPIGPVHLNVSGKTLALITGGGVVLGTLIVVGAIMPAEFNVDPLGVGKLSGIARLWAPDEKKVDVNCGAGGPLARQFDVPLRSDVIEIRSPTSWAEPRDQSWSTRCA